jgi:oxygen-independent coproporphyrinogen-3 oxidase
MEQALLARYDRPLPRYTSYPTAPHFSAATGAKDYALWLAAIEPDARASLYLHVPFCRSMCWFCGCTTSAVHSVSALERYATALETEIGRVAAAIGHHLRAGQIHWGGGTPTALPAPLLRRVHAALARHFTLDDMTEIAIEIDPRTLPDDATALLRDLAVTRVSLGVQDFAPAVQAAIGRHQSVAQTKAAADAARAAGIASVNFDLVYGLPFQTIESLEATIGEVLALGPDRVALYGYAHVPWTRKRQQVIAERALPDTAARFAQQQRAAELLVAAGYRQIGLDHFARPEDMMARAAGTGALRRNFQGYTVDPSDLLIGLGASAISRLPQGYAQNAVGTQPYLAAIEAGGLAIAKGLALDNEDRLRGAIIERLMCDLEVDLATFDADPERFGAEGAALAPMEADGLLRREGSRVIVTEAGRPFLRHAAAAFDAWLGQAGRHAAAI